MKKKLTEAQKTAYRIFNADLLRIPKDEPDPDELRRAHEAFDGSALRIDPEPKTGRIQKRIRKTVDKRPRKTDT